tara:strand:+ start:12598 stop:13206 length:609 start_codon:yes stop_codon:yes gene_type:complete
LHVASFIDGLDEFKLLLRIASLKCNGLSLSYGLGLGLGLRFGLGSLTQRAELTQPFDETGWDLIGLSITVSNDRFVIKASDLRRVDPTVRQIPSRDPEKDRPVVQELIDEDREVGRAKISEKSILIHDVNSDIDPIIDLEVIAIEAESFKIEIEFVAHWSCVEDGRESNVDESVTLKRTTLEGKSNVSREICSSVVASAENI